MFIQNLVYRTKTKYTNYTTLQRTVNFMDTDTHLDVVIGHPSGRLKWLMIPRKRSLSQTFYNNILYRGTVNCFLVFVRDL